MKTLTNILLAGMTKNEMASLTTEVKETIAIPTKQTKPFSAGDPWSIQRRFKQATLRRTFA